MPLARRRDTGEVCRHGRDVRQNIVATVRYCARDPRFLQMAGTEPAYSRETPCLSKGDFFQIFLECIPRREKASPRLYSAEKGRKTARIDRHWRTRRSWTRCGSGPFRPRKTCLAQKSPACKGVTFGGKAEEAFRLTRAARRCLGGCALCKKVPELFRLRSAKAGTGSRGLAWLTGQETPGVQAPERRHASSTPALENGCRLQGGVTRARSASDAIV